MHMCGDVSQFLSLKKKKSGSFTIIDSKTLQIVGKGKNDNSMISTNKVYYVLGLKHKLLNIIQLFDDKHTVNFDKDKCTSIVSTNKVTLVARREDYIYKMQKKYVV